ncbi:hypothetical protein GCM10010915_10410 [Microbacterium faecale]|uniref:Uncharacterized protein n=1 Tax=Microbacterium faecale TaxID=1804630 RepID=A0A916Y5V9_9MICO|nr:hypothetical protein GCM10010915_10410 [Microbacterium faecale]
MSRRSGVDAEDAIFRNKTCDCRCHTLFRHGVAARTVQEARRRLATSQETGAAMHEFELPRVGKLLEVAPDGHLSDGELLTQGRDTDVSVTEKPLEDKDSATFGPAMPERFSPVVHAPNASNPLIQCEHNV